MKKTLLAAALALTASASALMSTLPGPQAGIYTASKFAVRGLTEALRHEHAGSNLHVMCVHPGGIKTNIARAARMYVGPDGSTDHAASAAKFDRLARTTPEGAARKIYKDLAARKGRCLIGADAVAVDALARSMPEGYWKVGAKVL